MGKTLMGGSSTKQVSNLTKEQQQLFNALLGQAQQQAPGALAEALGAGQASGQLFQQAFVDPALLALKRDILPAITGSTAFGDIGDTGLHQALERAMTDTATMIGSQAGQYNLAQQQRQLQGLQLAQQLAGQKTFENVIQQQQGILGPLLQAGATIGGAVLGGPIGAGIGSGLGGMLGGGGSSIASAAQSAIGGGGSAQDILGRYISARGM